MSVSGVNPSSYSGAPYLNINRTENSKPEIEPAKMYKIGYDRVSKDIYDKYDTDRNNEISKEEETKYKSEKSTQKSDSDKDVEKTEKEPESKKTSLLSNLGNTIDLFA
jgi:hypothetical protein